VGELEQTFDKHTAEGRLGTDVMFSLRELATTVSNDKVKDVTNFLPTNEQPVVATDDEAIQTEGLLQ